MENNVSLNNHQISIIWDEKLCYPDFPYAPADNFPELTIDQLNKENDLYPKIRELFFNLGLDKENFGTKNWNPLKNFVKPGQTVLIKPNWVRDYNPKDKNIDSLITHASVVRPVLDYCILALMGRGKITIADAPVQDCDFENICKINGITELIKIFRGKNPEIEFEVIDLRKTILKRTNTQAQFTGKEYQTSPEGDPAGYSLIDLGQKSVLTDIDKYYKKYRITCYDHRLLEKHHSPGKHEYYIANSILNADAIINIPKLKTHLKAGLTGALKNFIGANGHKEYLPHHTNGCPQNGGDQYIHRSFLKQIYNRIYDHYWSALATQNKIVSQFEFTILRYLYAAACRFAKDNLMEGNWHGNKTIPRTTLDINNIIYFYDNREKTMAASPVRNVLTIIDGIIAGEGTGPLQPKAKNAGLLIAGFNPVLIDCAAGKLMGYNVSKIKTLSLGCLHEKLNFISSNTDIRKQEIIFNNTIIKLEDLPNFNFIKPKYWQDISI